MISERLVKVFSGLFIVLFALFIFLAYDGRMLTASDATPTTVAASIAPVALDAFGFEVEQFEVLDTLLQRRQTFSDLFSGFNIPTQRILTLAEESQKVMNVKRMRAGDRYRLYYDTDSLGTKTAKRLVYQKPDGIHYLVYDMDASTVTEQAREVHVVRKEVAGFIDYTLSQALTAKGAHPDLAWDLADIFAWKIDFYRIRRGDHFKMVYTEKFVDGKSVGIDKILGVRFNHMGQDYYALHFQEDDIDGYFDEKGDNVRSAFLMAPVKYSRISSGYSLRRFHPVQKRYKAHLGTDYAAPHGQPIYATGDGIVTEATRKRHNGKYVKIRHNGTYTTAYLHMSRIERGIRPGVHVKQGDVIGYVGSTGLATGPHVCYRFWKNGKQVDPRREELPTSEPIPETLRASYNQTLRAIIPDLHAEAALALR